MPGTLRIAGLLAVAGVAALLVACGSEAPTQAVTPKKTSTGSSAKKARPPLPEKYKGMTNAFAANAAAIEEGKALFNGKGTCMTCHGPNADGDSPTGKSLVPPAGNLKDPTLWELGDNYVFYRVTEGSQGTGMTPFEAQLSADERWKIVSYLKSLK